MTAIKSIKNNKSPGSGKTITVELLKYRGDSLHSAVLEITDGVLNQTETPKQWRGNIIIPIPKKASKHMKDLIPLITLMPIAGKVYNKIQFNRIYEPIDNILRLFQAGFGTDRSCWSKFI